MLAVPFTHVDPAMWLLFVPFYTERRGGITVRHSCLEQACVKGALDSRHTREGGLTDLSLSNCVTILPAEPFMTHVNNRKFCYSLFTLLPHLASLQCDIKHPCLLTDCTFKVLNTALTAQLYETGFLFWSDSNTSASQPCYCSARQWQAAGLTQEKAE